MKIPNFASLHHSGGLVFLKRLPIGAEGTLVTDVVNFFENCCPRNIVLGAGSRPDLVDHRWILGGSWTRRRDHSLRMDQGGGYSEDRGDQRAKYSSADGIEG